MWLCESCNKSSVRISSEVKPHVHPHGDLISDGYCYGTGCSCLPATWMLYVFNYMSEVENVCSNFVHAKAHYF